MNDSQSPTKNTDGGRQFSIASLLIVTLICALVVCQFISFESSYEVIGSFNAQPANDDTLRHWFQDQPNAKSVEISRQGEQIFVRYERSGKMQFLNPPWQELGYTGVKNLQASATQTPLLGRMLQFLVGASPILWTVIIAAIGLLTVVIQKYSRRVSNASVEQIQ